MALVTRILTNGGAPLYTPAGVLVVGKTVIFTLVDLFGAPISAFDALTGERVVGVVSAVTDAFGEFSVNLWPNDRGDRVTKYACTVNSVGAEAFSAQVPSGAGSLSWLAFKLSGAILTPAEVTALDSHIALLPAHGATGAVVGTTNVQTLTNKTITNGTLAGLTTDTTNGDQFSLSKDPSKYREGTWSDPAVLSGDMYTLLGELCMWYSSHNVALSAAGNFAGRDETDTCYLSCRTESGLLKDYYAISAAAGVVPTWVLKSTVTLSSGTEVSEGSLTKTGTIAGSNLSGTNTGDQTAAGVGNTPAGGISAVTVQAAINELDTEKASLVSPTFTGVPAAPTAAGGTSTTQLATTEFVGLAVQTAGASVGYMQFNFGLK